MVYSAPTSAGRNQGTLGAGSLGVVKADLKPWVSTLRQKAMSDLQARTEGCKGSKIFAVETRKAREPKLRLWHGTESNKIAKERIDLADLWFCKRSARYGGEP